MTKRTRSSSSKRSSSSSSGDPPPPPPFRSRRRRLSRERSVLETVFESRSSKKKSSCSSSRSRSAKKFAAAEKSVAKANPTRQLFDLLRRSSWESALRRCSTHPDDAAYRVKRPYHERYIDFCTCGTTNGSSSSSSSSLGVVGATGADQVHVRHRRSTAAAANVESTSTGSFRRAGGGVAEAYWKIEAGYTPLHMAVLKGAPPELVRTLAAAHPPSIVTTGKDDLRTPLHVLTELPGRKTARQWIDAANDAQEFAERYPPPASWLCLTLAVPPEVAGRILEYVPHPALLQDARGQTPLHKTCKRRSSRLSPVAAILAASCPKALRLADKKGWTPLHAFLFGRPSDAQTAAGASSHARYVRFFEKIADLAGPDVLAACGPGGVSPLHIACLSLQRAEIIRSILRRAPASATVRGCHGVLPLHLLIVRASRSGSDVGARSKFLGVVRELARADPASLSAPIPPYQFSLLDFCGATGGGPEDEGQGEGNEYQGPLYRGPMGTEVARAFRQISGEYRRAQAAKNDS